RVDLEPAFRADHAAEVLVVGGPGRGDERTSIEFLGTPLLDARDGDRIFAVVELLPPLDLAEKTLFGVDGRFERQVVGRINGRVIGHQYTVAERGRREVDRDKEA